MARFSVGSLGVADVDGVNNISYKVNPEMNGFTATPHDRHRYEEGSCEDFGGKALNDYPYFK